MNDAMEATEQRNLEPLQQHEHSRYFTEATLQDEALLVSFDPGGMWMYSVLTLNGYLKVLTWSFPFFARENVGYNEMKEPHLKLSEPWQTKRNKA